MGGGWDICLEDICRVFSIYVGIEDLVGEGGANTKSIKG